MGLIAFCGLLGWALAGLPLFVFPGSDTVPKHADVVVVLGGLSLYRVETAERLVRDGVVDEMLWSTPTDPPTEPRYLMECGRISHLVCFVPSPGTTQGEARELDRLATVNGWSSAIVVTGTAHIVRARLIISRCFTGRLTMVEAAGEPPYQGWLWQYLYQTGALVKAAFVTGC